jgi:hypothetical protein
MGLESQTFPGDLTHEVFGMRQRVLESGVSEDLLANTGTHHAMQSCQHAVTVLTVTVTATVTVVTLLITDSAVSFGHEGP